MKPTLEELDILMDAADKKARLHSDDYESKVGAILIDEHGTPVLEGYNTFVNGAHGLPDTRPDKYEFMIHAEANLVFTAAKLGISPAGKTLICTLSPCQNCVRTMFQAGIREIYYRDVHAKHNPNMRDVKVTESPYGNYIYMKLENYE